MNRVRSLLRVSYWFFRDPGFPLFARDSGFESKIGQDSGFKVCVRVRVPKIILGATGLHEILGRDYRIEEPYIVEHVI